jgi:hypothetical protein
LSARRVCVCVCVCVLSSCFPPVFLVAGLSARRVGARVHGCARVCGVGFVGVCGVWPAVCLSVLLVVPVWFLPRVLFFRLPSPPPPHASRWSASRGLWPVSIVACVSACFVRLVFFLCPCPLSSCLLLSFSLLLSPSLSLSLPSLCEWLVFLLFGFWHVVFMG